MISPILERLTSDAEVKTGSGSALDLVTVDTDAQTTLAQEYKVVSNATLHTSTCLIPPKISSLPTVIAFKDGKPVSQFIGAMPEGSVRNFLKTL